MVRLALNFSALISDSGVLVSQFERQFMKSRKSDELENTTLSNSASSPIVILVMVDASTSSEISSCIARASVSLKSAVLDHSSSEEILSASSAVILHDVPLFCTEPETA